MTAPLVFSKKSKQTPESPISYFMKLALGNPKLISLAAGLVDTPSLPSQEVADVVNRLMSDPVLSKAALQYGTTHGHKPLQEEIIRLLAELEGKPTSEFPGRPEDVLVTTGSQQLLYMISELLVDPGDIVITESPSYFVYHSVLTGCGAKVLSVPMDDEGMIVSELEELLKRLDSQGELGKVKLIYTVDYFQNPTGLTLSVERRRQLLELVKRYGRKQRILILEDAAYRQLRYDGEELPSIKSMDVDGMHVIYAGTFSKPCAPGLKTGYAVLPQGLHEPLVRIKGNHDFGSNNLSQYVLFELLKLGLYDRHLGKLRTLYREKRNTMMACLAEHFGDVPGAKWTEPKGGMFVWLTLPQGVSTSPDSDFLKAALALGVLYIPGEFGHVGEPGSVPRNEARLAFGDASVENIKEGVRRLRMAYDRACAQGRAILSI